MMAKKSQSAGILLYRLQDDNPLFFLVHPGGPFWRNKDEGSWTIPKGEFQDGESAFEAACREFMEETGMEVNGPFLMLKPVRQKSGKIVHAWAASGELNPEQLTSNTVTMEWPVHSGRMITFPEIDRGAWFDYKQAAKKINPAQLALLDELIALLSTGQSL